MGSRANVDVVSDILVAEEIPITINAQAGSYKPDGEKIRWRTQNFIFYEFCDTEEWTCGDWGECQSTNMHNRQCITGGKVCDPNTRPPVTESCEYTPPTPACTSMDFLCSGWSECTINGQQNRSCIIFDEINCEGGYVPDLVQDCVYTVEDCTEDNYYCTDWSSCDNDQQTRSCVKNAGDLCTSGFQPEQIRSCDSDTLIDLIKNNKIVVSFGLGLGIIGLFFRRLFIG